MTFFLQKIWIFTLKLKHFLEYSFSKISNNWNFHVKKSWFWPKIEFSKLQKKSNFGENFKKIFNFRIGNFWVLGWTWICQAFWRVLWSRQWHGGANPCQRRQSGWVYSTLRKALQTCGDLWRSRWFVIFVSFLSFSVIFCQLVILSFYIVFVIFVIFWQFGHLLS